MLMILLYDFIKAYCHSNPFIYFAVPGVYRSIY